jgi:SAM-dependent methyltransferase
MNYHRSELSRCQGHQYALTDFCACPNCRGQLSEEPRQLHCAKCSATFDVCDGIPILMQPPADKVESDYRRCYDRIAKDDLEDPIVPNKAAAHEVLLDFIGDVSGRTVLDIGSGPGLYLRKLNCELRVAVDIALPYLLSIDDRDGVIRICADAGRLPFKPAFFDVIIVSDILEHVLDPQTVVESVLRIAGPKTRIIVHVPWEEDLSSYAKMNYEFTHLRSFDSYEIFALFRLFRLRRRRSTYPRMGVPIVFRLEPYMPVFAVNRLFRRYFASEERGRRELKRRQERIKRLPRREWWLLKIYEPTFRLFEFSSRRSIRRRLVSFLRQSILRAP